MATDKWNVGVTGQRSGLDVPRVKTTTFLMTVLLSALAAACTSRSEPAAIALVNLFDSAALEDAYQPTVEPSRIEWSFDGESTAPIPKKLEATGGWQTLHGVTGLAIRDGHLVGRSRDLVILAANAPDDLDRDDLLYAIEIRLRVSAGTRLGVSFEADEKLDAKRVIKQAQESTLASLNTELIPGAEFHTYTLTSADSSFEPSFPLSRIRHVLIRLTDAKDFEIVSVNLVSLREHLASIPSGIGWQGLDEIYRESIVSRSPERISFEVDLPSAPFLDLAIGTIEDGPVTFRVEARDGGSSSGETVLLRRTVSTPGRWDSVPLDLDAFAGRRVTVTFALEADEPGTIGFWGSPVIRNRAGQPSVVETTAARAALTDGETLTPQGVILIVADTLRRDHLEAWGYERSTAPTLARLASEGVLFRDAIAQGTWTKVSVPSILTSLYPSTHGITDMPDRIPASVTTLAEVYRNAGYATFATSSVPFTGKLSNLHQGVEVLHERSSLGDDDLLMRSKTTRVFVDRLLPWLEDHRDVPFFVSLHVFDPHSPFEPYRPYDSFWMDANALAAHRKDMKKLEEFIEEEFMRRQGSLPTQEEIDASGIDAATYVERELAWYDASTRAMDVEIGRLMERLEELGLGERTLVAFVSDHGEEFLEHGRHFHGYNAYGEMLNVPLVLWWPGVLPAGHRVEETVQLIDLMPTLLHLGRLPVPEEVQGQSLLPLLVDQDNPAARGWRRMPAFAERAIPASEAHRPKQVESLAIVAGGWKLIKNGARPEDWPEFELYDHHKDPLNLENLAEANPQVVERLAAQLEAWHKAALEARVDPETSTEGLSVEEIQRLRSLGYVQ